MIYVGIAFVAWLLWLGLSEWSFRRAERLKWELHNERMRQYTADTERLYGVVR
jgi:hypothetical protein